MRPNNKDLLRIVKYRRCPPLHLARRCRGPNVPPHSHPRLRFMAFHPIISSLALLLIIVLLTIVLLIIVLLVGLLILLA